MVPVHVRGVPFFDWPLDFGATLRGRPLFGANKTWRGLVFGVAAAMAAYFVQQLLFSAGFTSWALIEYPAVHVLVGAAVGFGALVGDALESAVKRQLGIAPGEMFFFWDQMDFMLGALLVTIPFWIGVWQAALVALGVVFVLNLAIQRAAFLLGLKDDPL